MLYHARRHIDAAVDEYRKPFFLYFAMTTPHTPDSHQAFLYRGNDWLPSPRETHTAEQQAVLEWSRKRKSECRPPPSGTPMTLRPLP